MFPSVRALWLLVLLSACTGDNRAVAAANSSEPAPTATFSYQTSGNRAPSVKSSDLALRRLETALKEYREIEAKGGWPVLPPGPKLQLGAQSDRVAILRERLAATGDLLNTASDPRFFDLDLQLAVRRFQERHGLEIDGIVGSETVAALNVSVTQRVALIRLNLMRMTNEGRGWGPRYLVVNIPSASYQLVEDGKTTMAGRAIVGRPDWPTPRLDGLIKYLEFNPYWTVPSAIARTEIWPKIRGNPSYLARHHMHIINGQIRQDPGPGNPLGVVKFIFDNPYDVYLHDTNDRRLFAQPKRFLSHGCMRVSNAVGLARELLRADPDWPEQRVNQVAAAGRNIRANLVEPIPLHVIYDTAWVDDVGIVQIRQDVYGLDQISVSMGLSGPSAAVSSCGDAGRDTGLGSRSESN